MSYQFLHVETYARQAGKGKSGGHTINTVAAEVEREQGNCPHVSNVQKPILRYGVDAYEVAKIAEKWAEQAKDSANRKLRKDGLCLVAGVISGKDFGEEWEITRAASEKWLKKKYGARLISIIEHTDEPHPHIHFYVVPLPGEKFESIHQGKVAALEMARAKEVKGVQNLAYIDAMRALQDEYSESVGVYVGLTRIGPRLRRLSRPAWHQDKQQAKYFANAKAVHKGAFKKGLALGLARGKEQALTEALQAKNRVVEVAEVLGNFAKNIFSNWHQPTKEARNEARQADEVAKKVKTTQKKHEDRLKTELLTAQNNAKKEIETLRRVNNNYKEDLKSATEIIEKINAEMNYLRRQKIENVIKP